MLEYDKLFIGGEWAEPSGWDRERDLASDRGCGRLGSASGSRGRRQGRRRCRTELGVRCLAGHLRGRAGSGHDPPGRVPRRAQGRTGTDGHAPGRLAHHHVAWQPDGRVWACPSVRGRRADDDAGGDTHWSARKGDRAAHAVGITANISPWNGPLYMDLMTIVPALLAGCSVVAKPAVETPLTGFVLAEAMAEAGLPAGALSVLPADREIGQHLVSHPGIAKVSFIGSTAASHGRRVPCPGLAGRTARQRPGRVSRTAAEQST
jgi:hypothetical protein